MGEVAMEFDRSKVKRLVGDLFRLTDELQQMTQRRFTPDGHLVGSLGEVFAAAAYNLKLERASTKACDAKTPDGRRVEIKATFGKKVAFRRHDAECAPHHCLVLKLKKDGDFDEIYNGPMQPILNKLSVRNLPSNGQLQISLTQLSALNAAVSDTERLDRRVEERSA
jgi:hypothetical protein